MKVVLLQVLQILVEEVVVVAVAAGNANLRR